MLAHRLQCWTNMKSTLCLNVLSFETDWSDCMTDNGQLERDSGPTMAQHWVSVFDVGTALRQVLFSMWLPSRRWSLSATKRRLSVIAAFLRTLSFLKVKCSEVELASDIVILVKRFRNLTKLKHVWKNSRFVI